MVQSAAIFAAIGAGIVLTSGYWLALVGNWLAMPETIRPADVIAVHGGNRVRTAYGIGLFYQGFAPQLWHSSYPRGRQSTTTAVLSAGVPSTAFRWLSSTSTWTDGAQIADQARTENLKSVLIVTDWWHSRRAVCVDKHHLRGLSVSVAVSLAPAPYGPENWWYDPAMREKVVSELIKLVYYTVRYRVWPWSC